MVSPVFCFGATREPVPGRRDLQEGRVPGMENSCSTSLAGQHFRNNSQDSSVETAWWRWKL